MRPSESSDERVALLLLLVLLLGVHLGRAVLHCPAPPTPPCRERVHIQVDGEMARPGVYGFCGVPSLRELMDAAGGPSAGAREPRRGFERLPVSGSRVTVRKQGEEAGFTLGEMNGFYKMTLGIPLSLNREAPPGLSALPGVGPRLAARIVEERSRRGGFGSVEELTGVRGVGAALLERIRPFLVL